MQIDNKGDHFRSIIPKKFYNSRVPVVAKTVKTLIKHLQELPPNMKLGDQAIVVVYNIDYDNRHVGIEQEW